MFKEKGWKITKPYNIINIIAGIAILISDSVDCKTKSTMGYKERLFIMIKI